MISFILPSTASGLGSYSFCRHFSELISTILQLHQHSDPEFTGIQNSWLGWSMQRSQFLKSGQGNDCFHQQVYLQGLKVCPFNAKQTAVSTIHSKGILSTAIFKRRQMFLKCHYLKHKKSLWHCFHTRSFNSD